MDVARFSRITAPELIAESKSKAASAAAPAQDFKGLLAEGMAKLDALESEASSQVQALMQGEPVELHRVVLAGEEASLAFDMMLSVRNKVVEAYQEVMRMQV
ncbi:MAG: flagellar hook-basal body complex protein FliE [Bryobacterales bacterium]